MFRHTSSLYMSQALAPSLRGRNVLVTALGHCICQVLQEKVSDSCAMDGTKKPYVVSLHSCKDQVWTWELQSDEAIRRDPRRLSAGAVNGGARRAHFGIATYRAQTGALTFLASSQPARHGHQSGMMRLPGLGRSG